MLPGDPQRNPNNNPMGDANGIGKTCQRDGHGSRVGTIQAIGMETRGAGQIPFVECVIRIVQRRAHKRSNQDANA